MSFTHPWLLVFLLIPILLLFAQWKREGNRVVLPFDHGVQRKGNRWAFVLNLAGSLPAILLGVVILIIAGPQQLTAPKSKKVLTNIEFCVDVSGSMTSEFGEGTRYDASMKAINKFLDYREGDAFGLTFFGNEVLHWVPLTTDVSAIRCSPPFMDPKGPAHPYWMGGTSIGKALKECRKILNTREEGDRMIVLISDGYSSDLGAGQSDQIAQDLLKDNIVVYAIHISTGEAPDPIVNITGITGGEIFEPEDPAALLTVFERIDQMQETRLEKKSPETMDDFYPYSLAGLIVLGMSSFSLFGLRYTPW